MFFKMRPGLLNSSEKFHRNIFLYITDQNPEKVKQAMNEHIEYIHENYLFCMEKFNRISRTFSNTFPCPPHAEGETLFLFVESYHGF